VRLPKIVRTVRVSAGRPLVVAGRIHHGLDHVLGVAEIVVHGLRKEDALFDQLGVKRFHHFLHAPGGICSTRPRQVEDPLTKLERKFESATYYCQVYSSISLSLTSLTPILSLAKAVTSRWARFWHVLTEKRNLAL
jgi:hypothetical protein